MGVAAEWKGRKMARVPGIEPRPKKKSEELPHHDHYLSDDDWRQVVRNAQLIRDADPEPEAD